jgi:ABC-type nickel/cobalt efflux system permease component RcnA
MAISDLIAESLERPIATIRRYVISFVIALVAAVAAIAYAASALLLALEMALGPIGARLTVAAALLVVAVAGYFAPRLLRSPAPQQASAASDSSDLEGLSRDQRIAMVFEALMLGFSMGSRKPADSATASSTDK